MRELSIETKCVYAVLLRLLFLDAEFVGKCLVHKGKDVSRSKWFDENEQEQARAPTSSLRSKSGRTPVQNPWKIHQTKAAWQIQ